VDWNLGGIPLGSALYVAGDFASSCAEAVPTSVASARTNAREHIPAMHRSLSGLTDAALRPLMKHTPGRVSWTPVWQHGTAGPTGLPVGFIGRGDRPVSGDLGLEVAEAGPLQPPV